LLASLQPLEQQVKRRMNRLGGNIIQGLSQGAVAGDFLYRKHGFKIIVLEMILHPPLKGKYGRVLKKHHGQGTHQTVVQTIIDFACLSGVLDLFEKPRQGFSHSAEAQMFFDEHAAPVATDNLL
jgi:hypothetical protein